MFDTEKLFSAKPRYSKSVRTEHPRVAFTMPSHPNRHFSRGKLAFDFEPPASAILPEKLLGFLSLNSGANA